MAALIYLSYNYSYYILGDRSPLSKTDLKLETIHDMLLNEDFPNENIVHEQAVDQFTKLLDNLADELTNWWIVDGIPKYDTSAFVIYPCWAPWRLNPSSASFAFQRWFQFFMLEVSLSMPNQLDFISNKCIWTSLWTRNNTCVIHHVATGLFGDNIFTDRTIEQVLMSMLKSWQY